MARIHGARYTHTNLVARDWRRLAAFYQDLFGCEPVPPERDLSGPWLEAGTAVPGAHIRGIHLRLPGAGGATLEVFQYDHSPAAPQVQANSPGFAHIAFHVEDLPAAVSAVLEAGGSKVGETVSRDVPGVGTLAFAYVRDPEGNIVELQRWT